MSTSACRLRRLILIAALPVSAVAWSTSAPAQGPGASSSTESELELHDLVFLGPQGIVLLRLQIDNGAQSVTSIRREYAGVVFRTLDADSDGRLSPDEAARIPVTGQLAANAETLGDRWRELDRAQQDDVLTPEELFTFVDEQLGPRFKIELKTRLQQSVRLTQPLDLNGDEQVSREEVEQGLATLHQFDFDDDEALSVAELQPFPTAIRQALLLQQATEPAQLPIVAIDTADECQIASSRIITWHGSTSVAAGQPVGVRLEQIGGVSQDDVAAADVDGNGVLDQSELPAFLDAAEPTLVLHVRVRRNDVRAIDTKAADELVQHLPRRREAPNRHQLALAGMPVSVGASNNRDGFMSDATVLVQQIRIKLIEVDADKNRYLDEAEFAALRPNFAQIGLPDVDFAGIDANGDGMLTSDELKSYAETNAGLSEATLVLTVSDDAKTLFEILDGNLDNRLTPREFQEAYSRMRRYDHDRDGRLGLSDLRSEFGFIVSPERPDSLLIAASQQMMQNNPGLARITPMTSGPTWFRKMDRNQDGDLTWREFLGERSDFEQIDRDGNGLIDLDEAVAVDAP